MDSSITGYFTFNNFSQTLCLLIGTIYKAFCAARHKKDGYFKQTEGMPLIFRNVHCLLMPSNTKCSCLDCRFSNRWTLIIMGQFMKRNLTQWRIRYQSTHTHTLSLSLCALFFFSIILAMTERYKGCPKKTNILMCFLH